MQTLRRAIIDDAGLVQYLTKYNADGVLPPVSNKEELQKKLEDRGLETSIRRIISIFLFNLIQTTTTECKSRRCECNNQESTFYSYDK
jgi:hypothetical protein